MRRPTASPLSAVVLSAVLGLLSLSGCGDGGEISSTATVPTVPTTTRAATTDATTSADGDPTTTVPPEGNDPMDYEGQRYDFGEITAVEAPEGVVMITFNRQQLYGEDGTLQSGSDLASEPILYGNTDVPYVDDSPQLRTFVLADDAEILRIADPIPCASDDVVAEPVWEPVSVDDFVAGAWEDRLLDSLTFGDDGLVSRVRLSAAC